MTTDLKSVKTNKFVDKFNSNGRTSPSNTIIQLDFSSRKHLFELFVRISWEDDGWKHPSTNGLELAVQISAEFPMIVGNIPPSISPDPELDQFNFKIAKTVFLLQPWSRKDHKVVQIINCNYPISFCFLIHHFSSKKIQ